MLEKVKNCISQVNNLMLISTQAHRHMFDFRTCHTEFPKTQTEAGLSICNTNQENKGFGATSTRCQTICMMGFSTIKCNFSNK